MTRPALAVLVVLLAAPAAQAKTLRVNWLERKQVADGGSFVFGVTRIDVTPTRWSAAVSLENRTGAAYDVHAGCTGFAPQFAAPGMALVFYGGGMGWKSGTWIRGATATAPRLPRRLAPGDAWRGTMSGRGTIPRKTDLRLSFGFFAPAGETVEGCRTPFASRSIVTGEWFWVTDHTFRL